MSSTNQTPRFVLPDCAAVERAAAGGTSYAIYNYYGSGPIAAAKRKRFQKAIDLGASVDAKRVIDMGCADGLLLPTLSKHYEHVAAIDVNKEFVERSKRLAEEAKLTNVQVLSNRDRSIDDVRGEIGSGYRVMFVLETLEHVGSQPDMWGTKIQFLNECFTLLEADGKIVISVPKMVGMVMLFKNLLQRSLRIGYDQMTYRQLLKSAFLKNTDELEPLWDGHHVGFNHLKLDKHLAQAFKVDRRDESAISVFYLISKK